MCVLTIQIGAKGRQRVSDPRTCYTLHLVTRTCELPGVSIGDRTLWKRSKQPLPVKSPLQSQEKLLTFSFPALVKRFLSENLDTNLVSDHPHVFHSL